MRINAPPMHVQAKPLTGQPLSGFGLFLRNGGPAKVSAKSDQTLG
jgi:hypothetical protein